MSRRGWLTALVLLAVTGAGTGAVLYANRARAGEPAAEPAQLPTVPVTRGDLVTSVQQPGQLGFADTHQLIGHRAGTVTGTPRTGQVIDRGQPVYAVDQRPIPLLFGEIPLYRPLGAGATGEDVRELEANLVELGHGSGLLVDIRVTGPEADLGGVFEGPVTVVFSGETRAGVLSVPIEALVPGSAGGYAVVVVDSAGRRTIDVDTGLITASRVEIDGPGIAEGTRVEVPSL